MNNKRIAVYIGLLIVILFTAISCSSIPFPHDEDDTLLIIPVGIVNRSNEPWYGNYSYIIENISEGREVKIKKIPRTEDYTYVSTLPPGEYRINELIFFNNSKTYDRESRIKINVITFTLAAGKITILNKKFLYTIETPSSSGNPLMKPKFVPLSGDGVNEILEKLREDSNFTELETM